MKKEEIPFLNQLVKSLEQAVARLEDSYDKKDFESFNANKKLILGLHQRIEEALE